jgi:3D (Asp-Asp-Asp) domain-containing protein
MMPMRNVNLNACIAIMLLFSLVAFLGVTSPPVTGQTKQSEQTVTMQATAFNAYGWDENGIDYGPGYCIISGGSDIPLCSLLEIDQYGECQVIATSDTLKADEIQLWYNAPSKVKLFGQQEVQVKIKGEGDKPCPTIE